MSENEIVCKVCGEGVPYYLGPHLSEAHGLTGEGYVKQYPGAPTVAQVVLAEYKKRHEQVPKRVHPPTSASLVLKLGDVSFPVFAEVPSKVCLPAPPHYRLPQYDTLSVQTKNLLISLSNDRSVYVWGLPGSGKDAIFHYVSAMTRRPALIRSIKPNVNIQSWFYSRSLDREGTGWEIGPLLRALHYGYEIKNEAGEVVRRIPYMILISDLDRADRAQAEHLRLIMDSIQGRVEGPEGETFDVLPGTVVVATGNTAGAGDERGRCVSANVLDASIMDRFDRVYQFDWLAWEDEVEIAMAKFPLLKEKVPNFFEELGRATKAIRHAIKNNEVYAEFTHRSLCCVLGHATDLINFNNGVVPDRLGVLALKVWIDRLPDQETRAKAASLMDSHFTKGLTGTGQNPTTARSAWGS